MSYIVLDEMCAIETTYEDIDDATAEAFNVQGVVFDEDRNVIADYTCY